MDLFKPVVEEARFHKNFLNAIKRERQSERDVVQAWSEAFPDRDNKFVKEFQTTFNSCFWELYLNAVIRDYGYTIDWTHSSPDFSLETPYCSLVIEAVTANSAQGATPEWEKSFEIPEDIAKKDFWRLNREAIIRLSNALSSKVRKYGASYSSLEHVKNKPFVIAVAPFEQPHFQFQYDRPMRALLYDDYVDEAAYWNDVDAYPDGPPSVQLGSIEKDNGATVELGIFLTDAWSEVSAVIFSCVATWGKAIAMSNGGSFGSISSLWMGRIGPEPRVATIGTPSEVITDGLQVFHNPCAKHPLPLETFRRAGVVQHHFSKTGWVRDGELGSLLIRIPISIGIQPADLPADSTAR